MKSFLEWLNEATLLSPPNIGSPPRDTDDNNRGDDDEEENMYWQDGMEKQIREWAKSGSPCYKKLASTLSNHLIHKNDSKPDDIYLHKNVISVMGGVASINCEWKLPAKGLEFDLYERESKSILRTNCDLWKYINSIGYEKAWKATDNHYFMQYLFYYFVNNVTTDQYLRNHALFSMDSIFKSQGKKLVDEFISTYNEKYKNGQANPSDFKIRKGDSDALSYLTKEKFISDKTLIVAASSRITFDLIQ